jgi:hypothetical protein
MTVPLATRSRAIPAARRVASEVLDTFWLVVGGCAGAVLARAGGHSGSAGLVDVSLAFRRGISPSAPVPHAQTVDRRRKIGVTD